METKFTKGKWKYRNDISGDCFYIETVDQSHDKTFIGEIGGGLQSKSEIEANAKLIASAPEMFEALNEILEFINRMGVVSMSMNIIKIKAKQAIKKATE